jgi:hypothetical protein
VLIFPFHKKSSTVEVTELSIHSCEVIGDAGAAQHRRGSRPIPNKRGRQSRRRGPRRLAAPVGSPEAIVDRGLRLEEWDAISAHVHAADFPETSSRWYSLGYEAGFGKVRELFVSPTDLFRMYCFEA